MPSKQYEISPFGEADHPWINKADTAFGNDGGVFKFGLILDGNDAITFKDKVDTEVTAALARFFETDEGKKVPAKERKLWSSYHPYKVDTDDDDNPTGHILFRFKQNQTLKLKDGTVKVVKIGIKDATGKNDLKAPIWGGSELRAMFTFRDVVLKKDKQVGVQLAFAQVQVRKLGEGSHSGPSFDAVDGVNADDFAGGDEAVGTNTPNPAASQSDDF